MYRRTPLGLSDERAPLDGVASYAGSSIPGPQGIAPGDVSNRSAPHVPLGAEAVDESFSIPFAVGGKLYRLRHVDADRRQDPNEAAVPPEEAAAIIERAAAHHGKDVPLVRLLETAASRLAGLHTNGIYVLVWLPPLATIERVVLSPPAPTPRAPRPAPPDPPAQIEEPMAAAQARVLKNAAASGVPFCEECARLAAQRAAEPVSAVDI